MVCVRLRGVCRHVAGCHLPHVCGVSWCANTQYARTKGVCVDGRWALFIYFLYLYFCCSAVTFSVATWGDNRQVQKCEYSGVVGKCASNGVGGVFWVGFEGCFYGDF